MSLNRILVVFAATCLLSSCAEKPASTPLIGTWELISATSTEKDSTKSTFDPTHKMIKIINPTHFAFLNHDISAGKDTSATRFSAGGGPYTLVDSVYTEHFENSVKV